MKSCLYCKHFKAEGSGPAEHGFAPSPVSVGCDLGLWSMWDGSWDPENPTDRRHEDRPDDTVEFLFCLLRANTCSEYVSRYQAVDKTGEG